MGVKFDGPLIPFKATVSCKPNSSEGGARLHQFVKQMESSWAMHFMREEDGQAICSLRMAKTSRTCPPQLCTHVQTDLSSSSHAAKRSPGEALSLMKKRRRGHDFRRRKSVSTYGAHIAVHRAKLYAPEETTSPFHKKIRRVRETSLSQQRSTPIQIFDAFSRGHDPTAHARRARCLAHVGSIFNECVIVIVIVFPPSLIHCLHPPIFSSLLSFFLHVPPFSLFFTRIFLSDPIISVFHVCSFLRIPYIFAALLRLSATGPTCSRHTPQLSS